MIACPHKDVKAVLNRIIYIGWQLFACNHRHSNQFSYLDSFGPVCSQN